jgi:hypothetical protein
MVGRRTRFVALAACARVLAAAPAVSQTTNHEHSFARVAMWTVSTSVAGAAAGYEVARLTTEPCDGVCLGRLLALSAGAGLGFIVGQVIGLGVSTKPHAPLSDGEFRRRAAVWSAISLAVGGLGAQLESRELVGASLLLECLGVSYAAHRFVRREDGPSSGYLGVGADAMGRPQVIVSLPLR